MTECLTKTWKERKYRVILPLIHFLFSFVYERTIFIFEPDKDVVLAEAMNYVVSDRAERIFGYIAEKFFAFLFIAALWSIVWAFIDNFKKAYVKVLFFIWFTLVVVIMATYPYILDSVWDAYETYSYGIRFWPEYWHSAYSSLIYGGFLMVFPSPAAIQILQPLYAVGAIGYLYKRMLDSPVLKGRGRNFVWLFFLIPGEFRLYTSPYRTDQYAIFSAFLFAVLVMDIIDKNERPLWEKCVILFLTGFFSVWRTEGIIIGLCTVAVIIIFAYGKTKIEKAGLFLAYILFTFLLMIPQKLGDAKYYGKDYQFINSFASLYNILNDTAHNLDYEGVQDDLDAISAVVPLDLLTYRGIDGYRRYNYAQGRADINQSMVDKETASKYVKAYYNIVLHNIKLYAKTQLTAMGASMGFVDDIYKAPYIGGEVIDYPEWDFAGWSNGRADVLEREHTINWMINIHRQNMLVTFLNVREDVVSFFETIFYKPIACSLFVLVSLYVAIKEIVNSVRKRTERLPAGVISAAVLMELCAIMLVMPEDNIGYIQPTICAGMIVLIAYFAWGKALKKQ